MAKNTFWNKTVIIVTINTHIENIYVHIYTRDAQHIFSVLLLAGTWVTFPLESKNSTFYLGFKWPGKQSQKYKCWRSVTDLDYQVTYDIIARISSIQLHGNSGGQSRCIRCLLSSAYATAGKHLSLLFTKTSGGQWQQTAGEQQHLYHNSCFCSEHLPTADAFQP